MRDPLVVLNATAARRDARAQLRRGIALAQIDELDAAARTLDRAARAARDDRALAATARLALAEVELLRRRFDRARVALRIAARGISTSARSVDAAWLALVEARLALHRGKLTHAAAALRRGTSLLPRADVVRRAFAECVRADLLLRQTRVATAAGVLAHAATLAQRGGDPRLAAEVRSRVDALRVRLAIVRPSTNRDPELVDALRLEEIAFAAGELVVDPFARALRKGRRVVVDLRSRPQHFALLAALARHGASPATARELLLEAWDEPAPNESHYARLRMALTRLRAALAPHATIETTASANRANRSGLSRQLDPDRFAAWRIVAPRGIVVVQLASDAFASDVLAQLADGSAWTVPALARTLGASVRTMQRRLEPLIESGRVVAEGAAKAARYRLATYAAIASPMLLLGLVDPA